MEAVVSRLEIFWRLVVVLVVCVVLVLIAGWIPLLIMFGLMAVMHLAWPAWFKWSGK